jgi:opacity protein-like surface antigen
MPIYYGYRVTFFPRSGWFGLEGELIHTKVVADTAREVHISGVVRGEPVSHTAAMSSAIADFSITHGVNLVLLNAVARREMGVDHDGEARWALTARLGVGGSIPHAESTIDGQHVEGYQWNAFSAQAAAGLEVRLQRRLWLVGEYKLTRSGHDVAVADGRVRTSLTTHHVVVGASLRLGRHPRRLP